MAKGQDLSKYQKGIVNRYYENRDTIMANKLGEIVSDLYLCASPDKAERLWQSARTALINSGVPESQVNRLVTERKVTALAEVVNGLAGPQKKPAAPTQATSAPAPPPTASAPAPTPAPLSAPNTPAASPAAAPADAIAPETLKSALKAFRKRIKITRLDEESSIGSNRNPLTSGRKSQVVAIVPPNQFPRAVWDELVRQGKLKSSGRGFYELVEGM